MKKEAKKNEKKAAKPAPRKIEKKPAKTEKKPAPARKPDKTEVPFDSKTAAAVVKAGAIAPAKGDTPAGKPQDKKDVKPAAKPKEPTGTITLSRPEFEKDLAVACDFIEKKATLPVLTHVRIVSDGADHVTLEATNLEQWWTKIVSGKGPKLGRCIPAGLLHKEVKALPTDIVSVELQFKDDGTVSVNGRCTVFTMPASELPDAPEPKAMQEVHADNLVPGLARVAHAMGENDSRYVLNSAYIDTSRGVVVATDGHRLAYEGVSLRSRDKVEPVILPRRAVLLMAKYPGAPTPKLVRDAKVTLAADSPNTPHAYDLDVFGHKVRVVYTPKISKQTLDNAHLEWKGPISETRYYSEFPASLTISDGIKKAGTLRGWLQDTAEQRYMELNKTVAVTVNNAGPRYLTYPLAGGVMLTRAVEGNFPDYRSIIPKESPVKVKFSRQAFLQNIEGALPLMPSETKSVLLRVNGKLEIQTREPEKGEYKWHIPCESTGKKGELVLRFNIRYLVDAIRAFTCQDVLLEIKDQLGPCRVNTKAVVMPMRP